MSAVIGSDPDQLDQLAATMHACADRVDAVRSELAFVLVSSPWQGGDAEEFRWQWGHQLAGLLQGASAAFREASGQVRGNAAQQRQASADDGAGTPCTGRAGGGGGGWFDPLGLAAAFGVAATNVLGYASGAVGVVEDARDGLIGGKWAKNAGDQVVRFFDSVRVGGAAPLRTAFDFLGKRALPIEVVATVISGATFAQEAGKDVRSKETFDAGVSTALGVAGVVIGVAAVAAAGTAAAPVVAGVGLGMFVGSVTWDIASNTTQVDEWARDRFWDTADGVGAAVKTVGGGVGDIIGGGLNALLGR